MANPLKILYNKFFPSGIQTQNNNIDSQTFDPNLTHNVSMISGFDGVNEHLAVVDTAGNLHVNTAATAYYHCYVQSVSTTSTGFTTITFPNGVVVSEVIVTVGESEAAIMFLDTITGEWSNILYLAPGSYIFNLLTTSVKVQAVIPGNQTYIGVIGMY
jgi:hypothetical protein